MRKIVFSLIFFAMACSLQAQNAGYLDYLFPKFEEGTIYLSNGAKSVNYLNYSTVNQEMRFLDTDGETILTFRDTSMVHYIIIGERFFLNYQNKGFYERIAWGDRFFYIEWKSKIISSGKRTAMGARSHSASSSNFQTSPSNSLNSEQYDINQGVEMIPDCSYYILSGDKLRSFDSAKSLAKLLGMDKDKLAKTIEEEKINFKNPEDVKRLMQLLI